MDDFILGDGTRLHRHDWPAPNPRARLLLVHGLGEHGGRYARLADDLNLLGVSACAYDQRGHGLSAGARGAVPTTDALARDLKHVFATYANEADDVPFLLGHSMGGLVAMDATVLLGLTPRGLIASSPALATWAKPLDRWLAGSLRHVLPNLPVGNGLKLDKLSHDANVIDAYRDDPRVHNKITPRLGGYFFATGPRIIANAATLAVPTLLQIAGADELVNPVGARAFAQAAPPALLETHDYPGAYHEIYNEAEPMHAQVIADLRAWLQARLD